jgi:hypothetical protein
MDYAHRIIAIPAGECPVKLRSTTLEEVTVWCEEVVSCGKANNLSYLPSALMFFAQQYFDIFSEDYKLVCENIKSIFRIDDVEENSKTNELFRKIMVEKIILEKEKRERLEGRTTQAEEPKKRGRPKKVHSSPILPQNKEISDNKIKLTVKRK